MALLSNRQDFDFLASIRAHAAIDSKQANNGRGFTILEACSAAHYPCPLSEDDLKAFCQMADTWGIHVNVDQEMWFRNYIV